MATYTAVDASVPMVFGPFTPGDTPAPQGASGTQTVTAPGTANFTWPAGISAVTVQCWGAGSGAGGGAAAAAAGGSGGGGAYSSKVVLGVPGQLYPYTVGAGGAGGTAPSGLAGDGGDTTFNTDEVVAKGAEAGASATAGGVGGLASAGVGTTKFDGGNGRSQDGGDPFGGGSSAGTAADGVDAPETLAGATAPAGGGDGGSGGDGEDGTAGASPGGGGGGGAVAFDGGAGGNGKIVFTW